MWSIAIELATVILVAIIEGRASAYRRKSRQREEADLEVAILQAHMLDAIGRLGFITAKKVMNQKTNEDVEDAIVAYSQAKSEYDEFIQKMAAIQLNL